MAHLASVLVRASISSMRMGATHFLMKRLPKVATEMALHVLAYNLTRVMNIMGTQPLMAAIRASTNPDSACALSSRPLKLHSSQAFLHMGVIPGIEPDEAQGISSKP
jgi:hypothetical protein